MSIVAMMTPAVSVRGMIEAPRPRRGTSTTTASSPEVVAQLTRYIPTEAIALYVAILPFAVPKDVPLTAQDFTSRWLLAVVVGVAAVLFAVGVYRRVVLDRGDEFRLPIVRTTTVVMAYVAWVFAIPASPLNDFSWYTGSLGAVVGIAMNAAIALLHLWFGEPEA